MDLLEGFFKFLKTQRLSLDKENPTLLALSGGLDSVVMVHLFRAVELPFAIAHCNFQLRGAESDADEVFAQQIALDFDVPFFVKRFNTKEYAVQDGISTQMAARDLRYAWFAEIATEHHFQHIATAHHLNDSVETVILNFVRGTGLSGLKGISPITHLNQTAKGIIRPLLFASKAEILAYAQAKQLQWREDSSNASDDYTRNAVRHQIMPGLENLNPNFLYTAARSMGKLWDSERNLNFLLKNWLLDESITPQSKAISIQKSKLIQLPSPVQALREILKPYGVDAEQARQIAENLDHVGLEIALTNGAKLLIDRDKIQMILVDKPMNVGNPQLKADPLIQILADDLMVRLPDNTRIFLMPSNDFQAELNQPSDQSTILVDTEKLKFPLHLRHWSPGDAFQPLGMDGKSQKLQDFFTNRKLSRFEKDDVWLLINGDDAIIWVMGHRLDERFKIHSKTSKALKINWIK